MRVWTGIMMLVTVAALALAISAKEAPKCDYCGMLWDKSSTRVDANIVDGNAKHHHLFVSLSCMFNYLSENYSAAAYPASFTVVEYPTFGTKSEKMIDGTKAFYLYGTDPLKGSMGPFIAAYATEAGAKSGQAKLKGEILSFSEVKSKLTSGDEGAGGCSDCDGKCEGCDKNK